MPLSDHEKRLLEEMEEALASDDPRLVDALNTGRISTGHRLGALLGVVAGLAILLGGLVAKTTLIGVAGFAVALVSLVSFLRSLTIKAPAKPRLGSTFEQRWDRRNQG